MANLYELTNDFKIIQAMIEDGQEGLEDTLESIELAIEDKLENIGKVIRNLEGETAALKAEEKRLAEKRKSIENNIKRLKQYAEDSLRTTGERKVKTRLFTFTIQKNPPSVVVDDEKLIPKRYYIEQEPKLDKRRLINELKEMNAEEMPGVRLVQKEGLRIR